MSADLKVENTPEQILSATNPVRTVEHRKDGKGRPGTLSTSTDIEALVSITFNPNIVAVTINNISANTIFYKADAGTADDTNAFPIAAGQNYTPFGNRATLRDIRLFASSSSAIGIQEHILNT